MKEQQENNTGNLSQITFKLSVEERQIIDVMVESSGLNLSEYCRIKCLMEANTLISQRKRIAELEYEIKTLKVKLSCNNSSVVGPNDILLQLTEQQRNLLDRLYGKASCYYSNYGLLKDNVENDLNYNILYLLTINPIVCLCIGMDDLEDEDGNTVPYYDNLFDVLRNNDSKDDDDYWRDLIRETFPEHM